MKRSEQTVWSTSNGRVLLTFCSEKDESLRFSLLPYDLSAAELRQLGEAIADALKGVEDVPPQT
jgi:hypothetical protein